MRGTTINPIEDFYRRAYLDGVDRNKDMEHWVADLKHLLEGCAPEKDTQSEPSGTARKAVQMGYNLARDKFQANITALFEESEK